MAEKREIIVGVRLTPAGAERLDEFRGAWSRSEYIRRAMQAAVKNGLKGPGDDGERF